jgi:ribonuclease G
VLIPFSDKVSVSQKISSEEERKRLRMLVSSIKPANYGVIVRTVAEGRKVKDLDLELKGLVRKWETAFDTCKGAKPPHLFISELNRTSTILRDVLSVSFNNIFVNNETILRELREYITTIAPEKEKIVKSYTGNVPVFEHFGIDKQIKSSFGKTVSFRNGAYLIIEHTEALHVVDVNSGNRSKNVSDQETNAFETNSAAAEEIARQLRLRDMGGIIVIDFIDMKSSEHKQQITERMRKVMENDRAKHSILPLSKFGIMQITRQRVRPEMNISTTEKCPTCRGTGEISPSILFVDKIESHLAEILQKQKHTSLTLKVHSYVAAFILKGLYSIKCRWRYKYKCRIRVLAISSFDFLEYHIYGKNGEEIIS